MIQKGLYCPFSKFCVFLGGNSPESVLTERDYLSGRVDELEFAMDFSNRQVKKLLERIKELGPLAWDNGGQHEHREA